MATVTTLQHQEPPGQGTTTAKNRVVVTGFGPFRGVSDNPSQRLVEALLEEQGGEQQGEPSPIACCRVIEVSAVGAEAAVEALHCEAAASSSSSSDGDGSGGGHVVFLHMGVDGGAKEFKLECRAVNEADFRCPDERNYQPRRTPILPGHEEGLSHAYYSQLDLPSLATALQAEGWPVNLSHSAGRFVCNVTYFHSLHRCSSSSSNAIEAMGTRRASLFLHVPPFAAVPFERQLAFVRALIRRLAAMEPHPRHGDSLRALLPPVVTAASSSDEEEGKVEDGNVFVNDATLLPPPSAVPPTVTTSGGSAFAAAAASSCSQAQQQQQHQQQHQPQRADEGAILDIMQLGFTREHAEQALAAVSAARAPIFGQGAVTEAAVNWLLETERGSNPSAASSLQSIAGPTPSQVSMLGQERCKMVLVVRTDLGMSAGKIAAQCVHAALGVYQAVAEGGGVAGANLIDIWQAQGEPVIALQCDSLPILRALEAQATSAGLPTHLVRDAGRTQVEAGSITVLAVGPAPAEAIDAITGSLRLL